VAALALFALALQLCLSFAHIHHEDFRGVSGHGALTLSPPAQDDHDEDGDLHHCAVCVAVQITGTAFWSAIGVPDAPAMSTLLASPSCDQGANYRVTTAFRARGPPTAV
jgi:hypothetical protein